MSQTTQPITLTETEMSVLRRSFDNAGRNTTTGTQGHLKTCDLYHLMVDIGHPVSYANIEDLQKQMDTNKDGVVSFNEFIEFVKNRGAEIKK